MYVTNNPDDHTAWEEHKACCKKERQKDKKGNVTETTQDKNGVPSNLTLSENRKKQWELSFVALLKTLKSCGQILQNQVTNGPGLQAFTILSSNSEVTKK